MIELILYNARDSLYGEHAHISVIVCLSSCALSNYMDFVFLLRGKSMHMFFFFYCCTVIEFL